MLGTRLKLGRPEVAASLTRDTLRNPTVAIHVVVGDQAGCHRRDGDRRLPPRVRQIGRDWFLAELNATRKSHLPV